MLAQYLDSLGAINLRKLKKKVSGLSILHRFSYPFHIGKLLHRCPKIHFTTRLQAQPCFYFAVNFPPSSGSCSYKTVLIKKCKFSFQERAVSLISLK